MLKKEFWNNQKVKKITASLFLLAVFLLLSLLGTGSGIEYGGAGEEGEGPVAADEEASGDDVSAEMIFVDVIGCVKNPGVYQLPAESRVFQLIELAGGLTEDAEIKSINRAAILSDEQVIIILSVEEYEALQKEGGLGYVNGKVELNSADAKALESLSGIGPSTAQKILDYRQKNGSFTKVEDLMKVEGIGEKTFQRIKDQICVQ